MKTYRLQYNIGRAKYVVTFHDGNKVHPDGSPFFDICIFKNKIALGDFLKAIKANGYTTT